MSLFLLLPHTSHFISTPPLSPSFAYSALIPNPTMAPSSENPPAASAVVTSADASSSKSAVVKKMKTTSKAAPKTTHARVEDVVLPGEEAGEVAVFDCCTTIRKKITQFLGEGNQAAQFLRDLGGINTNALARAVPSACCSDAVGDQKKRGGADRHLSCL